MSYILTIFNLPVQILYQPLTLLWTNHHDQAILSFNSQSDTCCSLPHTNDKIKYFLPLVSSVVNHTTITLRPLW